MKYLITNADDFGYRSDISKAIIDSFRSGVLTSTTILINFISKEDLLLAQNVSSSLGFGLHLNITSGSPLTENWLKKYGEFSRPKRNLPEQFNREQWLDYFKNYHPDDIYSEYKCQIEKFIALFNKLPTHLDSHHYTSSLPNSFEAFITIAQEYKLPVRNQVMFDWAGNQHRMGNIDHCINLNKKITEQKIGTTNYFSLLYPNRYSNYLEIIKAELDKIENNEIIEISFHPGLEEDWRKKEYLILTNKELKNELTRLNVKLINYSDINFISSL